MKDIIILYFIFSLQRRMSRFPTSIRLHELIQLCLHTLLTELQAARLEEVPHDNHLAYKLSENFTLKSYNIIDDELITSVRGQGIGNVKFDCLRILGIK